MASLTTFRDLVRQYLKKAGRTQKELAFYIGLSEAEFTRRLNGKARVALSGENVKLIVQALAEWRGLGTREQAQELLQLMEVGDFTSAQWSTPGLKNLIRVSPGGEVRAFPQSHLPSSQAKTPPDPAFSWGGGFGSARVVSNVGGVASSPLEVRLQRSRPCPTPPPAPDYFGGRSDELLELKEQIRAGGEVVLTAVMGLGGIAKTTLARQLAYDLYHSASAEERVFEAVLWKEVKKQPNPLNQLLEWAYLAEPTFTAGAGTNRPEQLAHQVRSLFENLIKENCSNPTPATINNEGLGRMGDSGLGGPGRVLVVFDDVWDDGIDTVRLLRQACPTGATVLITSRSVRASQLLSQRVVKLDKLKPDKGVLLLEEYLKGFDPALLLELARVLDGHALALTLAARRVLLEKKSQQTAALARHIRQYQEELPAGTSFAILELEQGEDKEDNLTKALYYSYAELSPVEQSRFRFLGVLPYNAPFDETMLIDLWEIGSSEVSAVCKRLRLLSLIDEDEISSSTVGGNWYRQHPLVQSYAKALLDRAGLNPEPTQAT